MNNTKDHILIQRFIEEALTGHELKEFQERMTGDEAFRREVEFYYLLYSGIRLSREQELKNYITSNVSVKQYTPQSVIAIVIVMLIIIASGIGVWNYLEKDAVTGNKHFFSFNFFNKLKNKGGILAVGEKQKLDKKNTARANKSSDVPAPSTEQVDSSAVVYTPATNEDSLSGDENIVIKKDVMIFAAAIPVVNKSAESAADKGKESLSKQAADKLNPGAQLPDQEDENISSLQVEFWQSPVNYKGYRLLKNKLVLFGIEMPDAVKLYSLNDHLYMQYGQMVSRLDPAYDYQPFLALKESEIPAQLK